MIKNAADKPVEINLVDRREKFGRGVAYSTAQDFHLLNVPANKMGAFPDRLEHFHEWLAAKGYDFFPNDFAPRWLYGEYPNGQTINRDGQVSEVLYTVGTALKGVLWESTAMPEIRAQTSQLAVSLLDKNYKSVTE